MQKHKIIALVIAIPAAILLWMYVVTNIAPEQTKTINNIPVVLDGSIVLEERGLMITSGTVNGISLEVKGNRVSLNKINNSNMKISVDVSRIYEAGDYSMNYTVAYPDTVSGSQITISRRSVSSVKLTVSKVETKSVPVRIEWTGKVKDGYLFDAENAVTDISEITLSGPDYEVAPITGAVVVYDISELEETLITPCAYELRDSSKNVLEISKLTTVSNEQVTVTLPILRYKDVTLTTEVVPGGGATKEDYKLTMVPATIRVTGTSAVIDGMDDTLVVGTVELAQVFSAVSKAFPITLPAGVKSITGETEVKAIVRIVGLKTVEMSVTDIVLLNAPKDFRSELSTRSASVTLRGPADDIAAITLDKVHIKVDLSECTQSGAFTVPADVVIDGFPNIGVIGSVDIGVTIR